MEDSFVTRRLIALLALAAVGYGSLALLFPRFDSAARFGQSFDRRRAIAQATEVAARFDPALTEAAGWRAFVTTSRQPNSEEYLSLHPQQADALLTPVKTTVTLIAPDRSRGVQVELSSGGRPLAFRLRQRAAAAQPGATPPDAAATEAARAAATAAVNTLLGADSARFTFKSENDHGGDGRSFVWSSSPSQPQPSPPGARREGLSFTAEAVVAGAQVKEVRLAPNFDAAFFEQTRGRPRTLAVITQAAAFTLTALATLAALVLFLLSVSRREAGWRRTLVFFGLVLAAVAAANYWGGLFDDFFDDSFGDLPGRSFVTAALPWVALPLICAAFTLIATVLWGAGGALSLSYGGGTHVSLAALLGGKITARRVAWPVAAGVLVGGLVAALPYLLAASRAFGAVTVEAGQAHRTFSSPAPTLAALTSGFALNTSHPFFLLIVFGFAAPALRAALGKPALAHGLTLAAGAALFADAAALRGAPGASLLATGALVVVAYDQIYRRFDLLAVLAAGLTSVAALRAMALVTQPALELRAAGFLTFFALAAVAALALVGAYKGRDVKLDAGELAARRNAPSRAERERLRAEFGVARKAQQQMLPAAAPALDGFSLSAVCKPSREVGGDLYDFIPLPAGRLGVVVADVSGKGVPAALYMTLTKGLLLSVSETCDDPGEILREVNRHLYEACRRKTFVTLFFGVLDPATKTLVYARAGHNPPVWRQTAAGQTTLLRAPGLGLGLSGGKSFDRVLAVQSVQLAPQDALILYSDGITEAMNAKGEEYGELRLMALAAKADGMSAEEMRDLVLFDVHAFLGKVPPQDDQTLVVVRVN
jgi:serine phosphatase RsbU (regulator of sigma subunit)